MTIFKENNINLKRYNTLEINAKASLMLFPSKENDIKKIYTKYSNRNIILIGNGSNVLLSKEFYDDNYVFVNFKMLDRIRLLDNSIICESGAKLSNLSWFALEKSISGYEFLEDIPGTLGGAIIMNAGTYDDTIGNLVKEIKYFDKIKNEIIRKKIDNNDFLKRNSVFKKNSSIIIESKMKIKEGNYLESLDKLLKIKKDRYKKQPRNYPNAGSVFKKPKDKNGNYLEVWKLVDNVGLRGYNINDAEISKKHTGFIINKGEAKYKDIRGLIDIIRNKVSEKFNIDLELEWEVI